MGPRDHRNLLKKSIQMHVVPALLNHGFVRSPKASGGLTDRDSEMSFPLDHMVRANKEGIDLVEIQFARRSRAAFKINIGIAPKEGMVTSTGHWAAEEICVHWLDKFFEMYAFPRWRIWFSIGFWRFGEPAQSDYDELACQVAAAVPEIDLALREGKLGPHIRQVVIARKTL